VVDRSRIPRIAVLVGRAADSQVHGAQAGSFDYSVADLAEGCGGNYSSLIRCKVLDQAGAALS